MTRRTHAASVSGREICVHRERGGSRDGEETNRTQGPGPDGHATAREADGSRPSHPLRAEGETDDQKERSKSEGRGRARQARRQAGTEACCPEAYADGTGDAGDHAPSTAQPLVSVHGAYAARIPLGEPRVDRAR